MHPKYTIVFVVLVVLGGACGDCEDTPRIHDTGTQSSIPSEIAPEHAPSFSKTLDPQKTLSVGLDIEAGDRIAMYARTSGGSPGIRILREPSTEVAWHRPSEDHVAHIPYDDTQLQEGWNVYDDDTYEVEVTNRGGTSTEVHVSLVCRGGPCRFDNSDGDLWFDPRDPNPDTVDCGTDLRGEALKQRIRRINEQWSPDTYETTRRFLFGELHGDAARGIYTGRTVELEPSDPIPDPGAMNTEHTVPRSKFDESNDRLFTDLHHLFAASTGTNRQRSNLPFDEVTGKVQWARGGSKRGRNENGTLVFEPRDAHKGDAARAVFYVATVYGLSVDIDAEPDGWGIGLGDEGTLREWHHQDPPTAGDRKRNERIFGDQHNRNPFVDCPGYVGKIKGF